jgi:hypothetical protein
MDIVFNLFRFQVVYGRKRVSFLFALFVFQGTPFNDQGPQTLASVTPADVAFVVNVQWLFEIFFTGHRR